MPEEDEDEAAVEEGEKPMAAGKKGAAVHRMGEVAARWAHPAISALAAGVSLPRKWEC